MYQVVCVGSITITLIAFSYKWSKGIGNRPTGPNQIPFVFENEVLMNYSHAHHVHVVCGCFHFTMVEVKCCDSPYVLQSIMFRNWPFMGKIV